MKKLEEYIEVKKEKAKHRKENQGEESTGVIRYQTGKIEAYNDVLTAIQNSDLEELFDLEEWFKREIEVSKDIDEKDLDEAARVLSLIDRDTFDFFWERLQFWKDKRKEGLKEDIKDIFVRKCPDCGNALYYDEVGPTKLKVISDAEQHCKLKHGDNDD